MIKLVVEKASAIGESASRLYARFFCNIGNKNYNRLLIGFAVAYIALVWAATFLLLIPTPFNFYFRDEMIFLAGVIRLSIGQQQGIDFFSTVPPMNYFLPYVAWIAGYKNLDCLVVSKIIWFGAIVGFLTYFFYNRRRVGIVPAIFWTFMISMSVLEPRCLWPTDLGHPFYYNRIGYGALLTLFLFRFIPQDTQSNSLALWIDDIVTAILMVFLLLTKQNLFGSAVIICGYRFLFWRDSWTSLVRSAALTFAMLFIMILVTGPGWFIAATYDSYILTPNIIHRDWRNIVFNHYFRIKFWWTSGHVALFLTILFSSTALSYEGLRDRAQRFAGPLVVFLALAVHFMVNSGTNDVTNHAFVGVLGIFGAQAGSTIFKKSVFALQRFSCVLIMVLIFVPTVQNFYYWHLARDGRLPDQIRSVFPQGPVDTVAKTEVIEDGVLGPRRFFYDREALFLVKYINDGRRLLDGVLGNLKGRPSRSLFVFGFTDYFSDGVTWVPKKGAPIFIVQGITMDKGKAPGIDSACGADLVMIGLNVRGPDVPNSHLAKYEFNYFLTKEAEMIKKCQFKLVGYSQFWRLLAKPWQIRNPKIIWTEPRRTAFEKSLDFLFVKRDFFIH